MRGRLELTHALLCGDEFRHGTDGTDGTLDRHAFTARSCNCGLHRLADDKGITSRLSHVSRNENWPVVGDAYAYSRLNQDAVGKTLLNELLSLGEG